MYFEGRELSRLILGALRTAAEPLNVDALAQRVMTEKGFDLTDAILCTAIRHQVKSAVRRLQRGGTVENIGSRRASKWKLAGA
jgi:hypothetical protein